MDAKEALQRLKEGNLQYIKACSNHGNISKTLREETFAKGQRPYAVILTCSDSRVVPEHIFMCGLGELFVIRVAGNIVTSTQLASVVYATSHLKSPLVVILGHTCCGAIKAAMAHEGHGCLSALIEPIEKAIGNESDDKKACELNINASLSELKGHPEVQDLMEDGVDILGALYDIKTGEVTFL